MISTSVIVPYGYTHMHAYMQYSRQHVSQYIDSCFFSRERESLFATK